MERFDFTEAASVQIGNTWEKKIVNYYSEGNKKLSKATGLELGKFNYPLN